MKNIIKYDNLSLLNSAESSITNEQLPIVAYTMVELLVKFYGFNFSNELVPFIPDVVFYSKTKPDDDDVKEVYVTDKDGNKYTLYQKSFTSLGRAQLWARKSDIIPIAVSVLPEGHARDGKQRYIGLYDIDAHGTNDYNLSVYIGDDSNAYTTDNDGEIIPNYEYIKLQFNLLIYECTGSGSGACYWLNSNAYSCDDGNENCYQIGYSLDNYYNNNYIKLGSSASNDFHYVNAGYGVPYLNVDESPLQLSSPYSTSDKYENFCGILCYEPTDNWNKTIRPEIEELVSLAIQYGLAQIDNCQYDKHALQLLATNDVLNLLFKDELSYEKDTLLYEDYLGKDTVNNMKLLGYIPSPYLSDNSKNELFYAEKNTGINNYNEIALQHGWELTNILINEQPKQIIVYDQRMAPLFPAAYLCYNYEPSVLQDPTLDEDLLPTTIHNWYLGDIGEWAPVIARFKSINDMILAVGGVEMRKSFYWTSTLFSYSQACVIDVNYGGIYCTGKSDDGRYVRPFLHLS